MVTARRSAAPLTPPDIIDKLLRAAGDDLVLIGGQALAYWAHRYGVVVPEDIVAISADTDFLAQGANDREAVERMARTLQGTAHYPSRSALTSLVGQAHLDLNDDEFINVDVVFKVVGMTPEEVRKRQVRVELDGVSFHVLHPLDVLRSRLANLYELVEKQNPKGVMQLRLAVDVGRSFLRQLSREQAPAAPDSRSPLQPFVTDIERMALTDAGRKVAHRFGVHVADAIDPSLIPAGPFWDRKWPTLSTLMSDAYAANFHPPRAGLGAEAKAVRTAPKR